MGARSKLNKWHLGWITVAATVAGGLFQSWAVGAALAVALLTVCLYAGDVRFWPRK